jgi:ribosomal protein S18 acetylase RimI-like enzyme
VAALRRPGVVVTPHAELRGYRGVWFFVRAHSAVVSAPSEWVPRLERVHASAGAEELLSPASVLRGLHHAAGEIVGPSFQGWLRAERFRPVAPDGVQRVTESKAAVLSALRSSCSPEEWEHAGIEPRAEQVWASFQEEQAVAVGQLRFHSDGAVDPCVITHPAHRGQQQALRLVSAMAHEALSAGRLVLYQTLLSNDPAVSLALRLGFEQYATLLAVRLVSDAG